MWSSCGLGDRPPPRLPGPDWVPVCLEPAATREITHFRIDFSRCVSAGNNGQEVEARVHLAK